MKWTQKDRKRTLRRDDGSLVGTITKQDDGYEIRVQRGWDVVETLSEAKSRVEGEV